VTQGLLGEQNIGKLS